MIHGGDTISYKDKFEGNIIDFSSNINPLGPPKGLKAELEAAYSELISYPDIEYRELKKNAASYLGCKYEEVIVGSGAVEIINNICLLFKRAVVFTPCFYEYMNRPNVLGKEVVKLSMKEGFKVDLPLLKGRLNEGELLILGNPNNPTGLRIPQEELLNIYDIVKGKKAFLLLDEAFFEFCPEDYDSIELFKDKENVCVLRAATKFFGVPGIRLGYAFSSRKFNEEYRRIESPWSINSYANAAGRSIFKDMDYIKNTKKLIAAEREYLLKELALIKWAKVFESHANFILIKLLKYDENIIFDKFIKNGIMIRKCSTFQGLNESFIRIAVKSHEHNERLIKIFKEFKYWK